jgi:hypothetical protein
VYRKNRLQEEITEGLEGMRDVERRLRSIGANLYVVLVIILCYMLTSEHDSAASAVLTPVACLPHGFDPVDAFTSWLAS